MSPPSLRGGKWKAAPRIYAFEITKDRSDTSNVFLSLTSPKEHGLDRARGRQILLDIRLGTDGRDLREFRGTEPTGTGLPVRTAGGGRAKQAGAAERDGLVLFLAYCF